MTERVLVRALKALEPVRERLVVAGGTAHRLFVHHPLGRAPGFEPLVTEDVDLAASLEPRHEGGRGLLEALQDAGFEETVAGAEEPKYTYRLPTTSDGYVEFIADLRGSGVRRGGRKDRLLRFSGIHAEKLRHVGVLMHAPWPLRLRDGSTEVDLRVANPVAYLVQKLLVLPSRPPQKRAKDLLYVFDTLAIFAASLPALAAEAPGWVPPLSRKATNELERTMSKICFAEGPASRRAADIAANQRERPPGSAQIVGACEIGLRSVFEGVLPAP